MVAVKLLSDENGIIRYLYQPESDGEPGILIYDKERNIPQIEKLAEKDGESTFYRSHVFRLIRRNIESLPKESVICWY